MYVHCTLYSMVRQLLDWLRAFCVNFRRSRIRFNQNRCWFRQNIKRNDFISEMIHYSVFFKSNSEGRSIDVTFDMLIKLWIWFSYHRCMFFWHSFDQMVVWFRHEFDRKSAGIRRALFRKRMNSPKLIFNHFFFFF